MDRDRNWERTQKAYNLITQGISEYQASDALNALELAYERGETDEFVKPTAIESIPIQNNDAIIFMNFRADRARQITQALINPNFKEFPRATWPKTHLITLTEYDATFSIPVVFPSESLNHILGEILSTNGLRQLRIAETEKYAHVTFFFNAGLETPFPGEDRILIPSPKVKTYDLKPEMSAPELTDKLINAIEEKKYDIIICNFANPDMVGHTGNLPATIKAIETIDTCLNRIISALQKIGGEALITSDHGNAEIMFDPKTSQPHTAHTCELVPLLYIGRKAQVIKTHGILSDIAPTILYLIGLSQPKEMTGQTIFKLC